MHCMLNNNKKAYLHRVKDVVKLSDQQHVKEVSSTYMAVKYMPLTAFNNRLHIAYLVFVVNNDSMIYVFSLWVIDYYSWCRITSSRYR